MRRALVAAGAILAMSLAACSERLLLDPDEGTIEIKAEPADLEIPWHLTGPRNVDGTGSRVLRDLPIGDYTIVWDDIPGWVMTVANPQSQALIPLGLLSFSMAYVKEECLASVPELAFATVPPASPATQVVTFSWPREASYTLTTTLALDGDLEAFSIDPPAGELTLEPGQSRRVTVDFTPPAIGDFTATLAAGDCGEVPLTGSGGYLSWVDNTYVGPDPTLTYEFKDVSFASPDVGVVVGSVSRGIDNLGGVVLWTTNGGGTWERTVFDTAHELSCAHMIADDSVVVGGFAAGGGTLWRTTDGGVNWQVVLTDGNIWFQDIRFSGGSHGAAVGLGSTQIYWTEDGGVQWAPQTNLTNESLRGVDLATAAKGYAVGDRGTALFTEDGGAAWDVVDSPVNTPLRGVAVLGLDGAVIVGGQDSGIMLIRHDATANLTYAQLPGATRELHAVSVSGFDGTAVGIAGGIVRTVDLGQNWQPQDGGTTANLNGVVDLGEGVVVVVGSGGTILQTTTGGE